MNTLKKIFSLLSKRERRFGYLLLLMIIFMAFLDIIGVASIIPFLAVLGNPEMVETNRWLNLLYTYLNFINTKQFLLFLGMSFFTFLILSILFKLITLWAMFRFGYMRIHTISCLLFQGYLSHTYAWFLNRHSADLGKNILTETNLVAQYIINPGILLLAHGIVAFFLIILLVLVDSTLALAVFLVLGGFYLLIFVVTKGYIIRIGEDRLIANTQRFQVAQEAFSGVKEVKIFGLENTYLYRFINPSYRYSSNLANNQIAGITPRYLLEMVAFGGILLVTMHMFKTYENFGQILPTLGVYAFAGYRLLPALQNVFYNLAQLKFGLPALDAIYKDALEFKNNRLTTRDLLAKPLSPNVAIKLEDIIFTYPGANAPTLQNLNLKISVNTTVGLVGGTGSGKTTTVDIILGLLVPEKGRLLVDDLTVTPHNVRSWQQTLGYVPQHIYLTDDTVAANIAFGVPHEHIDMNAVQLAARISEIHDFVVQEMPQGYGTLVGECGVRLSGGQRQRIGIARALYHNPKVLLLDEATSALDNLTEKHVMQAIKQMKGERTIIIIAHRLTTVSNCDWIYLFDHGQVKAQGTYDDLLRNSEQFRNMAKGLRDIN